MMLALQDDLHIKKAKTEPPLNISLFGNSAEAERFQSTTTAKDKLIQKQTVFDEI